MCEMDQTSMPSSCFACTHTELSPSDDDHDDNMCTHKLTHVFATASQNMVREKMEGGISGVEDHCHRQLRLRLQIPQKAIEEEELIVPDLAAHTLIAHTFIMFVAHPRRQLHRRGGPLVRGTLLT